MQTRKKSIGPLMMKFVLLLILLAKYCGSVARVLSCVHDRKKCDQAVLTQLSLANTMLEDFKDGNKLELNFVEQERK